MKNAAILTATVALACVFAVDASAQSADDFFETRVRPVLAAKCAECHSAERRRGGLRLNTLEAMLAGGRSGPVIIPGDPDNSLLIRVVRHQVEDLEMPQDADPLTPGEIEGLAEWIRMDAPWPEQASEIVFASTTISTGMSPGARLFVDRVRPVIEQKCFTCHTGQERGGLRLDSRDRMLQGGGRGPAIIPGNPEGSLLIAALRHENADLQMPRNAGKLTDHEIEGFVEWIRAGAEWADLEAPLVIPRRGVTDEERAFWSFRPLAAPAVPTPATEGWAQTDVDRFVLAQLERQGLSPVAPAGKRQLIRRATYDLTGLPPTPEEIEAFEQDTATDAFEKVVERLLDSQSYGERWGRHWLDVTRFGEDDTRGLAQGGSGRERYPMAYVHRDWVVEAFNEDMPYDRFVKAQLAADLMPEDEREALLPGLGFLGQGPWYYDIAEPDIARADERHDRVDVTSRGFMGLTVGCARCHDHKYDPIGTHDYYSMAGIFNNAKYYEYPIADAETAEELKSDQEFIKTMEEGLGKYLSTEGQQLSRVLSLQTSEYMMAAWQVTGKEQIPVQVAAGRERLDLEVLERWIRFLAKEPKHYPFVTPWQEMVADEGGTEEKAQELADAFQRLVLGIVAEQSELEERNRRIIAKGTPLEDVESIPMPNGFESFFDQHQLELDAMDRERFNLYMDLFGQDLDNELDTFFRQPAVFRFSGWGLERQMGRVAIDHVTAMREEIKELKDALPDIPFVMGVAEKDSTEVVDIALHIRGSPKNLGEPVPRSFLHVLAPDTPERYSEGSGRLELAEDIVSHPITARVIVNRVWAWHMGSGIVQSPSNFGFAGLPPTNPELLEFLAARFVEGGMSIKQLHRDIMLSSVYQLAVEENASYAAIDPNNNSYWRFNRQRLDAESIRDALLQVSGSLDAEVGGPSLLLQDEKNNRRTIYGEVSRFQANEFLQTFDFPSPSLSAERRFATNVPLQSLYFMNSDFVLRQAESLVRRLNKATAGDSATVDPAEEGRPRSRGAGARPEDEKKAEKEDLPDSFDDRAMIEAAYPHLYGRQATEQEISIGLNFLSSQRASLLVKELEEMAEADATGMAEPDAEDDDTATEGQADKEALAARRSSMKAWVQYARALFSAAEFRFID
ncbi:MAG: PSD1 and planctomycete cytochrome C domain-containing protein [Gemmatimonadetes bacterium]|nr:PSD1 and planctomycete cytochrome C domain-containing protein [Gemmatimonadota bacterium]